MNTNKQHNTTQHNTTDKLLVNFVEHLRYSTLYCMDGLEHMP